MRIKYEWDYETEDANGDIVDHNFSDKLSDFHKTDKTNQLVLVKNEVNSVDGDVMHRTWAYVKNNILPEYFQDGSKVPIRFSKELKRYTTM